MIRRSSPLTPTAKLAKAARLAAEAARLVVASPRLFELRCKSVRQIALANAFCRYLELAREVKAP